jgi:Ala-tRNA(Pro) deacylase
MTIASTVQDACSKEGCAFEVVMHAHTTHSQQTAQSAHVPGDKLAKGVVVKDDRGPVLAVIPATHSLDMGRLNEMLGRNLSLVPEAELTDMFSDCAYGAVPPLGTAYNMLTVTDTSLLNQGEVWFEGGDHESLLHMSGDAFRRLMRNGGSGPISHHF